jgi:hypothetical protein
MSPILIAQTIFAVVVILGGAMAACGCSLAYFRRVRMQRPAIGTFNGRDIVFLSVFIVGLPLLYLVMPGWALTGFLIITFTASLAIGYRSLVPPTLLWIGIGVLLGADIWAARTMLGTVVGWQVFWAITSVIVLLGAVSVVNLYVQGGMKLRHVVVFAMGLAVYDAVFSTIVPITPLLADRFLGKPLDPSIGMSSGLLAANIGIGDLLVYGLFVVTAFKAYGKRAARLALATVAVFGAIIPACAPLVLTIFIRGEINVVVPAQTFFGPAATLTYLWLRKNGPERSMARFLASTDASGSRTEPLPTTDNKRSPDPTNTRTFPHPAEPTKASHAPVGAEI